jgi:hypothetical protein
MRNALTTSALAVDFRVVPHIMNRIDIATGVEFDQFIAAFEKAAPPVDRAVVRRSPSVVAVGMTFLRPRPPTRPTG